MTIRSFTHVHRKVIADLQNVQGGSPLLIRGSIGTSTNVVPNFRFAGDPTRNKNPAQEDRYPGSTLNVNTPRLNPDWQTVENTKWRQQDPDDPSDTIIKVAHPQKAWWLDYRLTLHTKTQHQLDDLIKHLFERWDRGHTNVSIKIPDEDESSLIHNAQVRLVLLVNRYRARDNVFMADFLVTIPISTVFDIEENQRPVESMEFTLGQMDDTSPDVVMLRPTVSILSGSGQSGAASSELSATVIVQATNSFGEPMADRQFAIAVTLGGGTVDPTSGRTDSEGQLPVVWTLGASGAQEIQASAEGALGSPIVVTATIV